MHVRVNIIAKDNIIDCKWKLVPVYHEQIPVYQTCAGDGCRETSMVGERA